MNPIAVLAYWLSEYVGIERARATAWRVTIAAAALLVGVVHLIMTGG